MNLASHPNFCRLVPRKVLSSLARICQRLITRGFHILSIGRIFEGNIAPSLCIQSLTLQIRDGLVQTRLPLFQPGDRGFFAEYFDLALGKAAVFAR